MHQELAGLPACTYLRISDDREGKRLGVERQAIDCNNLVSRLGVETDREPFTDNDISAAPDSNKPRPDFDAMVSAIRSGKYKVVVAYSTSRLTRDTEEAAILIDLGRKNGITFVFVASPAWELHTADGRQRAREDANRDRGEVERLQERIVRKKLADAQAGAYPGGRRCYAIGALVGVNPANGKEVRDWTKLDDTEVKVLREIADRIVGGDSQITIVSDLNQRGITTSLGTNWEVGKLKRTVMNETYVQFDPSDPDKRGTRQHQGNKYRAIWPAVFTHVEHEMLLHYFKHNPFNWQQGLVLGRRNLLSGLLECGGCGGDMRGQGRTVTGKYIRRYGCKPWNHRGERVGCGKMFRISEPVDQLVIEEVLYRFDSPQVTEALAPAENKERVRELTQDIVALQGRRQQLAMEHAITPYEDYGIMLSVIKKKSDGLQSELAKLRSAEAKAAMVPMLGGLREKFETATMEWKFSVISLIVEKVVIHAPGTKRVMWEGRQFDPTKVEIKWRY